MKVNSEAESAPTTARALSGPKPSKVQRVCSSTQRTSGASSSAANMLAAGTCHNDSMRMRLRRARLCQVMAARPGSL